MSETLRLFRIFLWKNWRQIRCTWISLLLIIIGCSGILNIYLYSTNKLLITPQTTYDRIEFNYLRSEFPTNIADRIFYAPNTLQTSTLMEAVRKELQYSTEHVISFDNSTALIRAMERDCDGNCYAVDFLNYPIDVATQKLRYSISSTIIRISPKKRYVNDEEVAGIKDDDDYIRSGFITLQHTIDKTFIKIQNVANTINFDFEIAPMPMIAQETIDSQRIIWFGSLYSILFNVLLLSTFLVPLVEEKQNGIKEFLAIATPVHWLNGASFFVIRFAMYATFTMIILIAGLLYHAFSEIVPIVYIIILFTLYILSAMSYTYLISVFFHSVFHAKVGGLILLVMPYILYFSKGGVSTIANIFSTKTFMEGIKNFQIFTNKYREVGPSVLNINITETSFTLIAVYSILIFQCLIYGSLYNYVSYIFPDSGSFQRPYLLPFKSLWKRGKPNAEYTTGKIGTDAIIIQDLKKAFKKPRRIISDGLNMAIKNKEITVLLGHNGAGKTTTLNMIMDLSQSLSYVNCPSLYSAIASSICGSEEFTDSSFSDNPKFEKINVITPGIVAALDRTNTTDRNAAFILTAAAPSMGVNVQDALSYSTIRRRMKIREAFAKELKITLQVAENLIVHWDGKILPEVTGIETVDRLPIVVTGLNTEQLLGVPMIDEGTGIQQATAVIETLDEWNLKYCIRGMCFDTAAVNTGSEMQDSGKITVCGESNVSAYRHLIGYCPQRSIFMPYMTCAEHLYFFAQVRGMSTQEAYGVTDELLVKLNLQDKENEFGNCLSGGMRRRLSLGIAISGNTKVVILDEPSSGLDIESRRELWDILLKLRKIKAILITTHHMEEAEVLGDTIAILANGRVHCTGSPLELKRKIGRGYVLKLCITNSEVEQAILQLIQHDIPGAKVLTIVPPAMHISLPYENMSDYSGVLRQLELRQKELGINSISISDASLEDVFLNCLSEIDLVDGLVLDKETPEYVRFESKEPRVHWTEQFKAIFYKKFIFVKKKWTYSVLMVVIPILSLVVSLALMHSMSLVTNEDKLVLNLKHIPRGIILINGTNKEIVNMLQAEINTYDGIKVDLLGNKRAENVTDLLTNLQYINLAYFLENYIGAIDVINEESGDVKFNIYYSGNIYHSSVILMNLIDDIIARWSLGSFGGIETTYTPIRRYITDVSPTRLEYYAVIMPIGLFFSIFFYIALPFYEHASGFKQLQPVPRLVFWFSTFAFDATLHFAICLLLALLQVFLMPEEFYSLSEQFLIITSIFFYGVSYLPILYSLANAFRSISTISTYMLFMLIVSAIIPLITSGNVRAMEYHEGIIFILMQLPDFNLNHQMRIINERFLLARRSELLVLSNLPAVLSVKTFFFESIIISVIAMTLFVGVLENKYKCEQIKHLLKCYRCRRMTVNTEYVHAEEELVANENSAVLTILNDKSERSYPLLVHDLYKFYDRKAAVCGLNFVVKKQECFGLLGVNGAGKTSTFQMITANMPITAGTIQIYGIDITANETEYRYRYGYCPQTDSLNEFMTAYQTLYYMAKLRGISFSSIVNKEVLYWLQQLDIQRYKDVEVRHYSGGTKRKLSAALAMIGSPYILFLDEPTTGVDPESRRFLWKSIKEYQSREKTVVLTSHSMDECEQLCNRLAIMTSGKFKWSGYVPDLKKKFGTGFTIKIKLKSEEDYIVDGVTEELTKTFNDCELRENHAGIVTYFIQNVSELKWSDIFKKTQVFSSEWSHFFEDYSVNETTLEDIFLKFESNKRRGSVGRQNAINDIGP